MMLVCEHVRIRLMCAGARDFKVLFLVFFRSQDQITEAAAPPPLTIKHHGRESDTSIAQAYTHTHAYKRDAHTQRGKK